MTMTILQRTLAGAVALSLLLMTGGCESKKPPSEGDAASAAAHDDSKATHAPHATASGEENAAAASHEHEHGHGHDHAAAGARGGLMISVGDHLAHLEITVDQPAGRISLYIMDCDNRAIRIAQEEIEIAFTPPAPEPDFVLPLQAVADSLTGETRGNTSAFSARCDELERLTSFEAVIRAISIRGQEVRDIRFAWPKPPK